MVSIAIDVQSRQAASRCDLALVTPRSSVSNSLATNADATKQGPFTARRTGPSCGARRLFSLSLLVSGCLREPQPHHRALATLSPLRSTGSKRHREPRGPPRRRTRPAGLALRTSTSSTVPFGCDGERQLDPAFDAALAGRFRIHRADHARALERCGRDDVRLRARWLRVPRPDRPRPGRSPLRCSAHRLRARQRSAVAARSNAFAAIACLPESSRRVDSCRDSSSTSGRVRRGRAQVRQQIPRAVAGRIDQLAFGHALTNVGDHASMFGPAASPPAPVRRRCARAARVASASERSTAARAAPAGPS